MLSSISEIIISIVLGAGLLCASLINYLVSVNQFFDPSSHTWLIRHTDGAARIFTTIPFFYLSHNKLLCKFSVELFSRPVRQHLCQVPEPARASGHHRGEFSDGRTQENEVDQSEQAHLGGLQTDLRLVFQWPS